MHTNRYTMAKNVFYIFAQMYTSYLQQSISRCLKGQNDEKKWIFCQCGPQKTKKNKKTVILFQIFFKSVLKVILLLVYIAIKPVLINGLTGRCFLASAVLACRIQAEILYSSARPIGLDPMCSCHDFALTKKPVLQLNKGKYSIYQLQRVIFCLNTYSHQPVPF